MPVPISGTRAKLTAYKVCFMPAPVPNAKLDGRSRKSPAPSAMVSIDPSGLTRFMALRPITAT